MGSKPKKEYPSISTVSLRNSSNPRSFDPIAGINFTMIFSPVGSGERMKDEGVTVKVGEKSANAKSFGSPGKMGIF